MSATQPFILTLDRPREIAWDGIAEARLDSVSRRLRTAGPLYHICALAWAMLVERDERFPDPESLGQWLAQPAQLKAAGETIVACRKAATEADEKKEGGST